MASSVHKKKPVFYQALSVCGSFLFVVIYLTGALQFAPIHDLVHPEASELHSAEHERQACHQVIYHQSKQECGHKVHVSVSEKCALCHIATQIWQLLPENSFELDGQVLFVELTANYHFLSADFHSDLTARGPPEF